MEKIDKLNEELKSLRDLKQSLLRVQKWEEAAGIRDKERALIDEINKLKDAK